MALKSGQLPAEFRDRLQGFDSEPRLFLDFPGGDRGQRLAEFHQPGRDFGHPGGPSGGIGGGAELLQQDHPIEIGVVGENGNRRPPEHHLPVQYRRPASVEAPMPEMEPVQTEEAVIAGLATGQFKVVIGIHAGAPDVLPEKAAGP